MHGNEHAPPRLAPPRSACLATTALLGAFVLLPATASGADQVEEIPQSKLDFRFKAPRVSVDRARGSSAPSWGRAGWPQAVDSMVWCS